MRILLVSGSLPPMRCGVGDYAAHLAGVLAADGDDVALLTSRGADEGTVGPSVRRFAIMEGWKLRELAKLWRVFREWRPDVVHVQYPTQGYQGGWLPNLIPLLSWIWSAKAVRTWHEGCFRRDSPPFVLQALAPGPFVVVRPDFEARIPRVLRPLLRGREGGLVIGASVIERSRASAPELEAIRASLLNGRRRLIAFFGFLYPFKGAEQLFSIANPETDAIVFVGEESVAPDYAKSLRDIAARAEWRGAVSFLGFLDPPATADVLAAADAAVLPFREGGGIWNSSIHAAAMQGTPVVTTSTERQGLDRERGVYYAAPDDLEDLREGLAAVSSMPRPDPPGEDDWHRIAREHRAIYRGEFGVYRGQR